MRDFQSEPFCVRDGVVTHLLRKSCLFNPRNPAAAEHHRDTRRIIWQKDTQCASSPTFVLCCLQVYCWPFRRQPTLRLAYRSHLLRPNYRCMSNRYSPVMATSGPLDIGLRWLLRPYASYDRGGIRPPPCKLVIACNNWLASKFFATRASTRFSVRSGTSTASVSRMMGACGLSRLISMATCCPFITGMK